MAHVIISVVHSGGRKGDLCLELTTDGAEILSKGGNLMDLFGEQGKISQWILNTNMQEIYTEAPVRFEEQPHILEVYHTSAVETWEKWKDDPKASIYFTPDKGNTERINDLIAKTSADAWAVYSSQKLCDAILETNARYATLKTLNEKLHEAILSLNYEAFKQDDGYGSSIKDITISAEKELDYCHQKARLMAVICKGDYNSAEQVSVLYRAFRNVDEAKNKEKLNPTVQENDSNNNTDNSVKEDKQEVSQPENNEVNKNDNPEGESHLRVV